MTEAPRDPHDQSFAAPRPHRYQTGTDGLAGDFRPSWTVPDPDGEDGSAAEPQPDQEAAEAPGQDHPLASNEPGGADGARDPGDAATPVALGTAPPVTVAERISERRSPLAVVLAAVTAALVIAVAVASWTSSDLATNDATTTSLQPVSTTTAPPPTTEKLFDNLTSPANFERDGGVHATMRQYRRGEPRVVAGEAAPDTTAVGVITGDTSPGTTAPSTTAPLRPDVTWFDPEGE
jgi:hypothetical protein